MNSQTPIAVPLWTIHKISRWMDFGDPAFHKVHHKAIFLLPPFFHVPALESGCFPFLLYEPRAIKKKELVLRHCDLWESTISLCATIGGDATQNRAAIVQVEKIRLLSLVGCARVHKVILFVRLAFLLNQSVMLELDVTDVCNFVEFAETVLLTCRLNIGLILSTMQPFNLNSALAPLKGKLRSVAVCLDGVPPAGPSETLFECGELVSSVHVTICGGCGGFFSSASCTTSVFDALAQVPKLWSLRIGTPSNRSDALFFDFARISTLKRSTTLKELAICSKWFNNFHVSRVPPAIHNFAIEACSSLSSFDISNLNALQSVRIVDCTSLVSITFPASLLSIEMLSRTQITVLDLTACPRLLFIGDKVGFCSSLLTLCVLPESVLEIGDSFLASCPRLRKVDLTRCTNLEKIGDDFLADCFLLEDKTILLENCCALKKVGKNFCLKGREEDF